MNIIGLQKLFLMVQPFCVLFCVYYVMKGKMTFQSTYNGVKHGDK